NTNYCSFTVTVTNRPTTLTYQGVTTASFASCVSVKAFLTDTLSNSGVLGKTITFTIGSSSTNAVTDSNGVAIAGLMLSTGDSPGNYIVSASFAGMCPFLASSDSDPFVINPGNAGPLAGKACYTGNLFFWTPNTNSSAATLALSAVIRDTNEVCNSD